MSEGILHCQLFVLLITAALLIETGQSQTPVAKNVTAVEGERVLLTCTVENSDGSPIQWANSAQQTLFFDEKKALKDTRIELVERADTVLTISITNATLTDEGIYVCSLFTKPVKTVSTTLTVLAAPKQPVITGYDGVLMEGDTIQLTCQSTGSKPAANIRWFKGNQELKGQRREKKDNNKKTFTVISTVNITVEWVDNMTPVRCQMDHPALRTTLLQTSQDLHVQYKPRLVITPSSDIFEEGDTMELSCIATGNPNPSSIQWARRDGEMPDRARILGNKLVITALNKTDNGTYKCEGFNNIGHSAEEYTLYVRDQATFAAQIGTDQAVIGGVVAVVLFITLCLLIVLTHYFGRQKGTYFTHEAKGAEDAPDADTAILNAEGGHSHPEEKKEYFL
ncbi:cell adhesion molecule 2-like [Petromyzon marinus]|uniref:Cell adhesion molecule 2-like n=1 Tax=Petromyzon marinus TaxID=7757 RepID=A0AAJ7TLP6_PETMA|nr:cell adhesion molecule 2-like [Petromyzon marinus]